MKARPCSMALLVEANRDGRLGDRERSSIARHLATCAECAALERDLDRIRALLRSPTAKPKPLEVQRGRLRLLREAAMSSLKVRTHKGPAVAAALAITAAAALVLALQRRSAEHSRAVASAPAASASVPFRTFAAVIPEGEAPFGSAASMTAPVQASAEPPTTATLVSLKARRAPIAARRASSAKPAPDDGTAAFLEGMAMMERGDYGDAARHLDAFSTSNPRDERAEDAAFLVVIALQYAGRSTEAVAAARRYLSTYPAGYRRAQARAIVEAPRAVDAPSK